MVYCEASVSTPFAGFPSSDERSSADATVISYFAAPGTGCHFRVGLVGNWIVAPSPGERATVSPCHVLVKVRGADQGDTLPALSTARTCQ